VVCATRRYLLPVERIVEPITSAEALALYRDIDDVNAAPGAAWIYNNGGWLMLSVAIERITGQSLEDVLASASSNALVCMTRCSVDEY